MNRETEMIMSKGDGHFRSSVFDAMSPIIPQVFAGMALIAGVFISLQETELLDLPLQYSYASLCIALSGIFFSFYVPDWLMVDFDLDSSKPSWKS
jgi:hypothetical protein